MSRNRDLTAAQRIAFSMPQVGIGIAGAVMGSWYLYFLVPPSDDVSLGRAAIVGAGVYAALQMWGKVVDAVADPVIGHWSDRTRTRLGRRLPFILYGTPLFALTYLAIWFPPFEPDSLGNAAYLAVALTAYWIVFTVVLGPYSALLPEITTTPRGRVLLSTVMGLFGALGAIVGLGSGVLISEYPNGAVILGFIDIGSGPQLAAVVGGVALLLCVTPLVNIRETPHSAAKDVDATIWGSVRSAAENPAFMPVVGLAFFFKLAGAMVVAVVPFLATEVLERLPGVDGLVPAGEGEKWQSILMAVAMGGAILWMPVVPRVARALGNKRTMILAGFFYATAMSALPVVGLFPDPAIPALVIMAVLAFPTSIALIMPAVLFADVIDFDEVKTGLRREGIYNGAVAFLTKLSEGIGAALLAGILVLGNSRSDPTGIYLAGPIAGMCAFAGVLAFLRFPEAEIRTAVAEFHDGGGGA